MISENTRDTLLRWLLSWGALALVALPAAWPYFGPGIPRTNDAPLHLYRVFALDRLIRTGYFWPRWSPDLVHGYGYPVFNFFSPLAHYSVALYHLAGFSLLTAYRLAILSQFVLAAWTTYLLAREHFGPAGGWVAAIAYTYSPYLLYDAHIRGGLAESLALALLPLLFLALKRAAYGENRWTINGAMIFGALILIHTPSSVQLALPLSLWLLWLGWERNARALWRPVIALATGALLVAGFWLPVLAERRYVQSGLAIARGYRFESDFLTLRQLWAFPRLPADPRLLNPPVMRSLPQAAIILALLVWLWRWRSVSPRARRMAGVWMGIGILCTLLILPQAIPLWRAIPLLTLTQFPWRLLGCISLSGAMGLAAPFAGRMPGASRIACLGVVIACLSMAAVPWLHPPREQFPEAPTLADLHASEHPPVFIGTTTLGEFLPVWAEELSDTTALRQQLAEAGQAERLVTPPSVTVEPLRTDPLNAQYRLHAVEPATLHYQQFYFPGWHVRLDGSPLALWPGATHGLIMFDVPAGDFTLDITFGATPIRRVGAILGGLTALGLVLFAIFCPDKSPPWPAAPPPALPAIWVALLVALVLGIHTGFAIIETPLRRTALGSTEWRGPGEPLMLDWAEELRLLAYEQSATQLHAAESLTLTLYWQALRPLGVVYDFAVDLVDEHDLRWNIPHITRPYGWRWMPGTDNWPLDHYVMDSRSLQFVDGTPPGVYRIQVAIVRRDTQQTVAHHTFGQLVVTAPQRGDQPLPADLYPALPAPAARWQLLGNAVDREHAAPGDIVRLTLLAQVGTSASADAEEVLYVQLVAASGEVILTSTQLVANHYPPEHWQAGERLRTEVVLRLPASTPTGEYTWWVQFADQAAQPVGAIHVWEVARLWEAQPVAQVVNASLGENARLVGADIAPGQTTNVTLTWQALAETTISYRVFVHLMDAESRLVAQSDAEPVNWTRPTTGWLPGEFVLDPHRLTLPSNTAPGVYRLLAGMYTPDGARLATPAGDDAVLVGEIVIETP